MNLRRRLEQKSRTVVAPHAKKTVRRLRKTQRFMQRENLQGNIMRKHILRAKPMNANDVTASETQHRISHGTALNE